MNTFRFTIKIMAIAIFTFALASMAQAQATRTWVSGVGDDANPCSRTAPCKTFAGAISKTAVNGEINALDSGGFGALTITKSITVEGGGNIAGVLTSAGNGILVNAPTDAMVTLRNLDINGLGTAGVGIKILAAKSVTVERVQIYGFRGTGGTNGRGISDERTTASPLPHLYVSDCFIRDNVGGIGVSGASAGPIRVVISNTRIHGHSSVGVFGSNSAVITIRNSQVVGSLGDGVLIQTSAQANVISSLIYGNQGVGVNNSGGTQLSIADVTIVNNVTGFSGTITTFGNNNCRNNAALCTLPAPVGQQ